MGNGAGFYSHTFPHTSSHLPPSPMQSVVQEAQQKRLNLSFNGARDHADQSIQVCAP